VRPVRSSATARLQFPDRTTFTNPSLNLGFHLLISFTMVQFQKI
jgi:hypothetical protein